MPEYAAICGITEEEIGENFMPELKQMSEANGWSVQETHDRLKAYYDGYHFSDDNMVDIYNPYSLVDALKQRKIKNYWASSGATSLLPKFVDRYPNTFKIINKENGGHGSAINTGVENVTGKYFKCVDADDWVYTDALERTMKILEKEDFDVLIQSFITYDISKDLWEPRDIHCDNTGHIYNLKEIVDMWEQIDYGMSFHGVTYNAQFYKSLGYRLIEGVFYEDQEYATIPLSYAKRIRLLDDELYVYRLGDVNQSVSTQSQLSRLPHFEAVLFKILEHEKNLDKLPEGGRELWTRKISMYLGSLYHILFIKNPDKKSQRKSAKHSQTPAKLQHPCNPTSL